ncbi:spore germination protein [Paenibacillus sp.]|uniref:spore germination protein n=1 Tax=Paenibacillus sp. TaxID=58172 RepID=UPI002D57D3F2|nr:spore germination protein [Paenibacillus sp.]HZG55423.1 spore germination protein [Paenibacillus sp.]
MSDREQFERGGGAERSIVFVPEGEYDAAFEPTDEFGQRGGERGTPTEARRATDETEAEPDLEERIREGIPPKKKPLESDLYMYTEEEKEYLYTDDIPTKLSDVKRVMEERAGFFASFDAISREMTYGGKKTALYYLNGFAKDEVLTMIMSRLSMLPEHELSANAAKRLFQEFVAHVQVDEAKTMTEVIGKVLNGGNALFIEGESTAIVMDVKSLPQRGTDEPSVEKVVRGARDGFIETLLTNVTLLRRRLKDPRLKLELQEVGRRTKTAVCVAYIQDIADVDLVKSVKAKIGALDIDGLAMADKELEEAILDKGWNPFPIVRYTERPDVAAYHLLEGHICVFVDTSPSVIILPATFFHHVQHAEEYRQTPLVGTYLRWVRYFGVFASIFLLPLWFLFVLKPELRPMEFAFVGPQETGRIPILAQFLLVEVGVDMMRLAAIHTPTPLASAMGLIAAILVGDIAIKAGLFVNEVILYMAVAAIGMFATPSYELALANRLVRIVLLIAVAVFGIPGFAAGTALIMLMLITQRSHNTPYMWPFIPFNAGAMLDILLRRPFPTQKYRMTFTKPQDRTRKRTGKK